MAIDHILTRGWQKGSDILTKSQTVSADQEIGIDASMPIANDQLVALALDVSQMKGMFLLADQDLTLETNNATTPAATIALKANVPLIWESTSGYFANPLGVTDVTALYVTNASAAVAKLQCKFLTDPTI